jgi:hypothetical protein
MLVQPEEQFHKHEHPIWPISMMENKSDLNLSILTVGFIGTAATHINRLVPLNYACLVQ